MWRGQLAQGPHERQKLACPGPAWPPRRSPCLLGCSQPLVPGEQVPEALCLVPCDRELGLSWDLGSRGVPKPWPHCLCNSSLEPASPHFQAPGGLAGSGGLAQRQISVSTPQGSASSRLSPGWWSLGSGTALCPPQGAEVTPTAQSLKVPCGHQLHPWCQRSKKGGLPHSQTWEQD